MSLVDWLGRFVVREGKCKYNFPHSPRFPKSIYEQSRTHSWMYVRKWDGRWGQDVEQMLRTDKGKQQLEALRRFGG